MKKILFGILLFFICTSCNFNEAGFSSTMSNGITYKNVTSTRSYYSIVEVTYNGKTHECLEIHGSQSAGIMHWPDCKYCKHKETFGYGYDD